MERTPRQLRNDLWGAEVVKALTARHFDAQYCPTAEEAVTAVLSMIPNGSLIAWGGSVTLAETGIMKAIRENGGYSLVDRDTAKTPEERVKLMKQGLTADYFLLSANAISEDGVLINVDGNGNRVAALCYGPDNVIVVAGMNKVAPDVESAYKRARGYAGPVNQLRFKGATPCTALGSCKNCKSRESICSQIVATRLCKPAGRIKVILIGEDFGF